MTQLCRRFVIEAHVMIAYEIHMGTSKTCEKGSTLCRERFASMNEQTCAGKGSGGLLIGDGVNHMRNSGAQGWFANAVKHAQAIDPSVPGSCLTTSAASLAISSGANVKAAQRMRGHASAAMTLDTYADLSTMI